MYTLNRLFPVKFDMDSALVGERGKRHTRRSKLLEGSFCTKSSSNFLVHVSMNSFIVSLFHLKTQVCESKQTLISGGLTDGLNCNVCV